MSKYSEYASVPWLRRSGTNSAFMVLHVLTFGVLPLLLITCIIFATGDIYYNQIESSGTLKTWSKANKVIVFALLLAPLVLIGVVIATIAVF